MSRNTLVYVIGLRKGKNGDSSLGEMQTDVGILTRICQVPIVLSFTNNVMQALIDTISMKTVGLTLRIPLSL